MAAAAAAAAAAASLSNHSSSRRSSNTDNHPQYHHHHYHQYYNSTLSLTPPITATAPLRSRYELQKRRDWNAFGNYLRNHRPSVTPSRCSVAHVLEFLRHLDQQFRNTKVHNQVCPFSGYQNPLSPCPCPPRQGSGSLDAIVRRLRAAFEENGGVPETNPFGAHDVRLYLREVSER